MPDGWLLRNHYQVPEVQRMLKRAEDALDAVACPWVAICFLEGRAEPFGDDNAAMWVPVAGADEA